MRMPSASKLQTASICPPSATLPGIKSLNDAAEAGTWKHRFLQLITEGKSQTEALLSVPSEWRAACEAIDVDALAPHLAHLSAEVALAYNVERGYTRLLGRDIEREYGALLDTEVAMSIDYAGVHDDVVVVVDLKTGRGRVPAPRNNWQLKTNALALARLYSRERAVICLALAPEGQDARWESVELDGFDLEAHAYELRGLRHRIEATVGDPNRGMISGDHCRYCPARFSCPAQVAMVQRLASEPDRWASETRELLTPQTAALAWQRIKVVRRLLEGIEAGIYSLATETPLDLGNGTTLRLVESTRESIDGDLAWPILEEALGVNARIAASMDVSKTSIKRALSITPIIGQTQASRFDAILTKLRSVDAVKTKTSRSVKEV